MPGKPSDEQFGRALRIIARLPIMATERDRQAMVIATGFQSLSPLLDLSGSPMSASAMLLDAVRRRGALADGRTAFSAFLTAIADMTEGEVSEQLLSIVVETGEPVPLTGPDVDLLTSNDEKIIGANTLRPVEFLHLGARASESVARVTLQTGRGQSWGTCFLLDGGVVVTNHHVLPDANACRKAIIEFNFHAHAEVRTYVLEPGKYFASDVARDLTVVAVSGAADHETAATLSMRRLEVGDRVNIVQHPQGGYKQVSLQDNRITYVDATRAQYRTATMPGSSGSPVFNDDWTVAAVHRRGGHLQRGGQNELVFTNEGVMSSMLAPMLPGGA